MILLLRSQKILAKCHYSCFKILYPFLIISCLFNNRSQLRLIDLFLPIFHDERSLLRPNVKFYWRRVKCVGIEYNISFMYFQVRLVTVAVLKRNLFVVITWLIQSTMQKYYYHVCKYVNLKHIDRPCFFFHTHRSVSHLFHYDSSTSPVDSFRIDLSIFRIPRSTIRQMINSNYSLRDRISVTQKKDPQRRHNVVTGLHSLRNVYYISTDMFKLKNNVDSTVTFLFSSSSARTGSLEILLLQNVPHKELDALSLTQAMMTWLSSRLVWISRDGNFFRWHRVRHCWRHLSFWSLRCLDWLCIADVIRADIIQ